MALSAMPWHHYRRCCTVGTIVGVMARSAMPWHHQCHQWCHCTVGTIVMAPPVMPWHHQWCHGTVGDAVAPSSVSRHRRRCRDTIIGVIVRSALLSVSWYDRRCRGTINGVMAPSPMPLQHHGCHCTVNDAVAPCQFHGTVGDAVAPSSNCSSSWVRKETLGLSVTSSQVSTLNGAGSPPHQARAQLHIQLSLRPTLSCVVGYRPVSVWYLVQRFKMTFGSTKKARPASPCSRQMLPCSLQEDGSLLSQPIPDMQVRVRTCGCEQHMRALACSPLHRPLTCAIPPLQALGPRPCYPQSPQYGLPQCSLPQPPLQPPKHWLYKKQFCMWALHASACCRNSAPASFAAASASAAASAGFLESSTLYFACCQKATG